MDWMGGGLDGMYAGYGYEYWIGLGKGTAPNAG